MSVTSPQGFVAGGTACGIKSNGAADLAIVATADRKAVTAAGVFTTNMVAAAPVQISRRHIANGRAAAVVVNSGNANAATGAAGRDHAERMCKLTANGLGIDATDVLVCSTGLIGIPFPMEPVESVTAGIPALTSMLGSGEVDAEAAATAILTTDTKRKVATVRFETAGGAPATLGAIAKGAAMLSPAMATMLCVITTDAAVDHDALQRALVASVSTSFDCLNVDGARSTNDTVIVLANGAAGGDTITTDSGAAYERFRGALSDVCSSLAEQMARDAEGATKFVRVRVRGARCTDDARRAARAITNSQLVQCSLHGNDPYWGRVLSECGASGAFFDPENVEIAYNGALVCRYGIAHPHDGVALAKAISGRDITIDVDLRCGYGEATMFTTDLSPAYIDENMKTS